MDGFVAKDYFRNFLFKALFCIQILISACLISAFGQSSSAYINHTSTISNGLNAPLRIAVSPNGTIYVTDAFNKSISRYDDSGNFIDEIRIKGVPVSVAVNSKGELFIGDELSGNILKYEDDGSTSVFYSGTKYPSSMVFSPDDVLYIADSELAAVFAVDISANLIKTIGSGTLLRPTGITFDNANQRILVAEHGGTGGWFSLVVRVYIFKTDGTQITYFGRHGNSDGYFYRIQGITAGNCGNIYVVDPYLARISVFNENGYFIRKFGEWGSEDGQLNIPMDIAFGKNDEIIISSLNNGKLEIFSITEPLPSATIKSGYEMICSGETSDIEIEFSGTAPWTFEYTINGLYPTSITTSDNPYLLNVSAEGLYEITALSDADLLVGTCFTGSAYISVATEPPTVEMIGDMEMCEGESTDINLTFTGSSPWTFTYTRNGEDPQTITTVNNPHTFSVSAEGLYEITEIYGGGCQGTEISGSANIIVNPLPTATMPGDEWRVYTGPGETAYLPIELSGEAPWIISYTINDANPVTIGDIYESPYILSVSEEGTYEPIWVSDNRCFNENLGDFKDVQIVSPPTAVDDFAEILNGNSVVINILENDFDLDGEIIASSVSITEFPLQGSIFINSDGSVTYTPNDGNCSGDYFEYRVADNKGLISNSASVNISIEDITPPELTETPGDISVSCKEIPLPPELFAVDNCDEEVPVTYLGEARDNSCGNGFYTLTRSWEASDNSGNITTHTQIITVGTAFDSGCYTLKLLSSNYSPLNNETSFYWELSANNCAKELAYIVFEMPVGIIALDHIDRSVYQYSGNDYDYTVHNPAQSNKNDSYGIKFLPTIGDYTDGGPETFSYILPGEINMDEVDVEIKSGKNIEYFSVPISTCSCSDDLIMKNLDSGIDFTGLEPVNMSVYPNPFKNIIFFEFQSPVDSHGRLELFSITGSKIVTLYDNKMKGGHNYIIDFQAGNMAKGFYFYTMTIGDKISSGKIIYEGRE